MYNPLELVDKCIGTRISILTKEAIEFEGILRGFDDYLTMVMDDVTELYVVVFVILFNVDVTLKKE